MTNRPTQNTFLKLPTHRFYNITTENFVEFTLLYINCIPNDGNNRHTHVQLKKKITQKLETKNIVN